MGPRLLLPLVSVCVMVSPHTADAHPIHTTLTVVSIDVQKRITLSIRVFADDFSAAVARAAGKSVPRDSSAAAEDVRGYVRDRVTLDGVDLEPCGIRRVHDSYVVCMHGTLARSIKGVEMKNRLLTELHGDQVNIVQTPLGTSLFTGKNPVRRL